MPRHAPWLLLSALLLSGCAGPAPVADASDPTPQESAPPGGEALSFAGCRQFHTAFPGLVASFEPLMPDGFTVRPDEAGLAQLQVIANSCTTGPGNSLWVRVPADPPAHLQDPQAASFVVIEAYLGAPAQAWAQAVGFHLAEPCVCIAEAASDGPVLADTFVADGEQDHYVLRTALAMDDGPFPDYRSHLYLAGDGPATLRIVEEGWGATNRGLGTGALSYTGPGAAPPHSPGEAAHVIDGLGMTWTAEAVVA